MVRSGKKRWVCDRSGQSGRVGKSRPERNPGGIGKSKSIQNASPIPKRVPSKSYQKLVGRVSRNCW